MLRIGQSGLFWALLLSCCSVSNTGVRVGSCPPGRQGATKGLLLAASSSEPNPPWLGGVFSYSFVLPHLTEFFSSPATRQKQCSGLFDFSGTSAEGYKVTIWSHSSCIDFFYLAEKGEFWVWKPASETMQGGYLKFELVNPGFARMIETVTAAPKEGLPTKQIVINTADFGRSPQTVPWIQRDIGLFMKGLSAVDADTALPYYCGKTIDPTKPDTLVNNSPVPTKCVWPQGLQSEEFVVRPVAGSSTAADLDELVTLSASLFKKREGASALSDAAAAEVRAYQGEWRQAQRLSNKFEQWMWLRKVFAGVDSDCGVNPETRVACLRLITKFFLPEEKAFAEKMISEGLPAWAGNTPPAQYTEFQSRYETQAKVPYLEALRKATRRWVSIVQLMQKEKGALQLVANFPDGDSSTELKLEPLFPQASVAQNPLMKSVTWGLTPQYLTLEFPDATQKFLRRDVDTGATILFGNYPILAVPYNAPEGSDGVTQIPLPAPQKTGADSDSRPACK